MQFGTGSDLIIHKTTVYRISTLDVQELYFFFFFASLLRHSMHSTEIPLGIFSVEFTMKSVTSCNNSMLLALLAT